MTVATRTNLEDVNSLTDALDKFNYEVQPMQLIRADGKSVETHKATVRVDNGLQLGIVGTGYSIVQMSDAVGMLKTIVSSTQGARLKSATIFDGGRLCRLSALVGEFDINGKFGRDTVQKIVTVGNSFDGSSYYEILFEENRKVCSNGMRRNVKTSSVKLRHTGDTDAKQHEALRIMGMAEKHFAEFEQMCNQLANQIIDRKLVDGLIATVVGDLESTKAQNIAAEIENLIGNGIDTHGTTRWDALNAVTEYYDHKSVKDDEKRLASSLIGNGMNKKIKAMEYLLHA